MMVTYRALAPQEPGRIGEIDRSEQVVRVL
jgi:hypothetical protein